MVPLLSDEAATPEAWAVFDGVRAKRGPDHVDHFWSALVRDPEDLRDV